MKEHPEILVWYADQAEQIERDYKWKVLREMKEQEAELMRVLPQIRLGGKRYIEPEKQL